MTADGTWCVTNTRDASSDIGWAFKRGHRWAWIVTSAMLAGLVSSNSLHNPYVLDDITKV